MRSHAKASTAGSTQRQAKGLGRFLGGSGVPPRDVSAEAKGSGASTAKRLILPTGVFAVLVVLMIAASPAGAAKTHVFKETFGSAAQPSFSNPLSIAVDQSSGDVLVATSGGNEDPAIKRFKADGAPDDFSGLGTNVIDGKGGGECATVPADCDQTPQNGLAFSQASEAQIAVDDSGGATDGDIYVTSNSPNAIDIFSKEGKYLGQLTESSAGAFSEACGVAVDPSGVVYVGDYTGGIHKFVPAANPPVDADNTANFTTVSQPCALAAGTGPTVGYLFANSFNKSISKLDSATGEVKYVVSNAINNTVSVDPGTGHVYAASGSTIEQFDASGAASATAVGSVAANGLINGISIRGSSGNLYAAVNFGQTLSVYGPLVSVPTVATVPVSNIQPISATLNGTVNPDGLPVEECEFEYGLTTNYGQTVPCAESPGSLGAGTSDVAVSAPISGLAVGAVYHYRLVAKNENSSVNGSDATFQTGGPVISDAWTDNVLRTEATVKAKIDPEGNPTTYRVEWGPNASYGSSTAEIGVGSDSSLHEVGTILSGLNPGTTYHWRIVATGPPTAVNIGLDHEFTTYDLPVPDADCPNQAFRFGSSAILPDCRAYEMVSPIDKGGADITTKPNGRDFKTALNQASLTGNKFTYSSYKAFGDALGSLYSNQYLASRRPGGWTSHAISPPHQSSIFVEYSTSYDLDAQYKAFTDDLSTAWLLDDADPPLTSDALEGTVNLYSRGNSTDSYNALTKIAPAPGSALEGPTFVEFEGHSKDGSHAVFAYGGAMTPDAHQGDPFLVQLYDFSNGAPHLVSVLPDGTASPIDASVGNLSPEAGAFRSRTGVSSNAVSDDGSRIFWNAGGKVYVRIDGERTVPVSESVTPGEAMFLGASRNGSKAIFTVPKGQEEEDLYEFDVDTETATLIAHRAQGVMGISDDASYVYFVSKENLASGAADGQPNLYLDHAGSITFIADLSGEASLTSNEISGYTNFLGAGPAGSVRGARYRASRVTPDGHSLAFESTVSLTGYDNTDSIHGEPDLEVFHYSTDTGTLTCASCDPSGARAEGQALQQPFIVGDEPVFGSGERRRWSSAWLTTAENSLYTPRTLSDDGNRLFFNSFDALVPQDTNGVQDVYEWEAQGTGSCEKADGCISLISPGQSPQISEFVDASPDGRDVFFSTSSSLDPRDPGLIDIYDARSGGGSPPPPAPPVPCLGDACQNVPPSPNDATPASANFHGAGDVANKKRQRRCPARKKHRGSAKAKAKHTKAKSCRRANRRAKR